MNGKELKAWAEKVPDSAIILCADTYASTWKQEFKLGLMSNLQVISSKTEVKSS